MAGYSCHYVFRNVKVIVMASRIRHLRARLLKTVFRAHANLYEVSGGRIGAWIGPPYVGQPALLLSVTGRKSGLTRTTPLVYFEDGGNYVVVGSDGAARRDPQWWKNLQGNPQATLRVGRNQFSAEARLATGAERTRLWKIGIRINPMWARYQAQTERPLPIVVLSPIERSINRPSA
jgi:deazaflavin-dependent oxidoreductase (nitroreductase family)